MNSVRRGIHTIGFVQPHENQIMNRKNVGDREADMRCVSPRAWGCFKVVGDCHSQTTTVWDGIIDSGKHKIPIFNQPIIEICGLGYPFLRVLRVFTCVYAGEPLSDRAIKKGMIRAIVRIFVCVRTCPSIHQK